MDSVYGLNVTLLTFVEKVVAAILETLLAVAGGDEACECG